MPIGKKLNRIMNLEPELRTKQEVECLRTEGAVYGGCCNRFADNQGCDCLERAKDAKKETTLNFGTPEIGKSLTFRFVISADGSYWAVRKGGREVHKGFLKDGISKTLLGLLQGWLPGDFLATDHLIVLPAVVAKDVAVSKEYREFLYGHVYELLDPKNPNRMYGMASVWYYNIPVMIEGDVEKNEPHSSFKPTTPCDQYEMGYGDPANLKIPRDPKSEVGAEDRKDAVCRFPGITASSQPTPPRYIQAGDVVRIRSGSPHMTVSGMEGDLAYVAWWEDGKIRADEVPVSVLEKVPS